MRTWCRLWRHEFKGFEFDGLAGQRGLAATLTKVQSDTDMPILMVYTLSDLGRDLPALVKLINQLLTEQKCVHALSTGLKLIGASDDPEVQVIKALAQAHVRYTADNRKLGQMAARALGAGSGRPVSFTLDDARESIEKLMRAADGHLPSSRKLAKEIGCGPTKARYLLKEYVADKQANFEDAR